MVARRAGPLIRSSQGDGPVRRGSRDSPTRRAAGQTSVTYLAPDALGARHHLDRDLTESLAGIGPLTDALVAPAS